MTASSNDFQLIPIINKKLVQTHCSNFLIYEWHWLHDLRNKKPTVAQHSKVRCWIPNTNESFLSIKCSFEKIKVAYMLSFMHVSPQNYWLTLISSLTLFTSLSSSFPVFFSITLSIAVSFSNTCISSSDWKVRNQFLLYTQCLIIPTSLKTILITF